MLSYRIFFAILLIIGIILNPGTVIALSAGATTFNNDCGDGILDIDDNETCDDGNTMAGDGCNETCQIENDTDADDDGLDDQIDNCIYESNPNQEDTDNDSVGDACDSSTDSDGDDIADANDNCLNISNSDQADIDSDGIGDACDLVNDLDPDADEINNALDNCPSDYNPEQTDIDSDGIGDVCDSVTNNEPVCGNWEIEPPTEQCDDGNTEDGDGCSSTCQTE